VRRNAVYGVATALRRVGVATGWARGVAAAFAEDGLSTPKPGDVPLAHCSPVKG
jgi:hypothetical protein